MYDPRQLGGADASRAEALAMRTHQTSRDEHEESHLDLDRRKKLAANATFRHASA
jgi:hypothetical protein